MGNRERGTGNGTHVFVFGNDGFHSAEYKHTDAHDAKKPP